MTSTEIQQLQKLKVIWAMFNERERIITEEKNGVVKRKIYVDTGIGNMFDDTSLEGLYPYIKSDKYLQDNFYGEAHRRLNDIECRVIISPFYKTGKNINIGVKVNREKRLLTIEKGKENSIRNQIFSIKDINANSFYINAKLSKFMKNGNLIGELLYFHDGEFVRPIIKLPTNRNYTIYTSANGDLTITGELSVEKNKYREVKSKLVFIHDHVRNILTHHPWLKSECGGTPITKFLRIRDAPNHSEKLFSIIVEIIEDIEPNYADAPPDEAKDFSNISFEDVMSSLIDDERGASINLRGISVSEFNTWIEEEYIDSDPDDSLGAIFYPIWAESVYGRLSPMWGFI